MHQPHLRTRRPGILRRHLPARERLRLANRKRAPLVVAMLSAAPILYLLSVVLSAQP
ncbi:MAG: hypothetical protein RR376_13455 [Janthinobacterium sp.]|jgi:hypothetical protein|uniref:hypothetical protein n=1 Tax=unclassified Janthinobacterium TaxID=2610881 RepID=UPI0008871611|nr:MULTISPECIES: hypothetical protein [unclassified Janthinobacterium]SDA70623.1 hypothetical protein SAMN03159349_03509 [Janthinobacterium sp. 551a]SFB56329.1 hypothetical protein SAMN03159300_107343 [Janthinobacterium sp. 344]